MSQPVWRSPLVLMTGVAGLVGVALVLLVLTGVVGKSPIRVNSPTYLTPTTYADGRSVGKADAPVKLDLYSDFQCPVCESFTTLVEPKVMNDFVRTGKLRITYHDYLVIDAKAANGHESHDAAGAARCAADQGKFWPYHDWLFANQQSENSGHFTKDLFDSIAQSIGVDQGKFDACYDAGANRTAADAESTQATTMQFIDTTGATKQGLPGTPTLLVNGREIAATYDAVAAAVNGTSGGSSSSSPSASPASSASTAPTSSGSATP